MTQNIDFLLDLENVIRSRLKDRPENSYTARLASGGDQRIAQKVGEEAVELALAAVAGDPKQQLEEAADLLFHVLVLLNSKDLGLSDVVSLLAQRHGN